MDRNLEILNKLNEISSKLEKIEKQTNNMDIHINFIHGLYTKYQSGLDFVHGMFSRKSSES
jgi:hypothetical protein